MLLMKLGPNEALVQKGDDSWGSELNLNYLLLNDFKSCKVSEFGKLEAQK